MILINCTSITHMQALISFLKFQIGWWACIWGAGHGYEITAILFCSALGLHHIFTSKHRMVEVKLCAFAVIVGILVDSLLQSGSVITFYGWYLAPLSPFWLWVLWGIFATTLNTSLWFLQTNRVWISGLLGAVLGPLTYIAGVQCGAAGMLLSVNNFVVLSLTWLVVLPLLVIVARYLNSTRA